ncbi:MAG TPA: EpsI family protein [Terriglobales bacterium]|jgi:EpsI family protein|nr:EpsI family protein [Terriglobales bacterium]
MKSQMRFVIAFCLLLGTALFLQARNRGEVFPPRKPLSAFPQQLGDWTGTDVEIGKEILDVLGPGDFMLRVYRPDDNGAPATDLFIAYFPSQRAGDTIHSPKNCLPGAGWTPIDSSRISLSVSGHAPFPVNRYVIAKGTDRLLVLYWYWAHDRAVASEYWAKVYLVTDSIRMNRSDGALVRVNTRMLPGESVEAAMARLSPFAGQVVPLLNEYIPQ